MPDDEFVQVPPTFPEHLADALAEVERFRKECLLPAMAASEQVRPAQGGESDDGTLMAAVESVKSGIDDVDGALSGVVSCIREELTGNSSDDGAGRSRGRRASSSPVTAGRLVAGGGPAGSFGGLDEIWGRHLDKSYARRLGDVDEWMGDISQCRVAADALAHGFLMPSHDAENVTLGFAAEAAGDLDWCSKKLEDALAAARPEKCGDALVISADAFGLLNEALRDMGNAGEWLVSHAGVAAGRGSGGRGKGGGKPALHDDLMKKNRDMTRALDSLSRRWGWAESRGMFRLLRNLLDDAEDAHERRRKLDIREACGFTGRQDATRYSHYFHYGSGRGGMPGSLAEALDPVVSAVTRGASFAWRSMKVEYDAGGERGEHVVLNPFSRRKQRHASWKDARSNLDAAERSLHALLTGDDVAVVRRAADRAFDDGFFEDMWRRLGRAVDGYDRLDAECELISKDLDWYEGLDDGRAAPRHVDGAGEGRVSASARETGTPRKHRWYW